MSNDHHERELVRLYHLAQAASDKAFMAGDAEAEKAADDRAHELLAELASDREEDPALTQAWIDAQD